MENDTPEQVLNNVTKMHSETIEIWSSGMSSEHLLQKRTVKFRRAGSSVQSRQNFHYSLTLSVDLQKISDKKAAYLEGWT